MENLLQILLPIILGGLGYLIVQFYILPVVNVRNLRKEMHEKILQYSNIWGIDPNDSDYSLQRIHNAREDFRALAARGLAEHENLQSCCYCLARLSLWLQRINIKTAAEKFWTMEADVCGPDKKTKDRAVNTIREALNLPQKSQ